MSDAPDTPEARYDALVAALLGHPEVTHQADVAQAQRFGASSLKVKQKIFAMLVKGRLVLKLPRQRVDALIAARAGERFDPGHGRPMKEWVALEPAAEVEWMPLAREALLFVSGQAK